MISELIGQMPGEEFDALLDGFIESGRDDPLPAEAFVELWADIEDARKPVEIEGMIVKGKLVFLPPAHADVPLVVRENEIAIGGQVIRIRLAPTGAA